MAVREVEIGGRKFLIHEGDDAIDSTTGRALTGSWLWESAIHLAEWMASSGLDLTGKTVLELGAGTGLPGLAAASALGAARVFLTDVTALLPSLRRNAAANGVEGLVEVRELRWGCEGLGSGEAVDVVVMSDVFVDPEEMEGMASTLRGVCGEGTRVWAASEVRASAAECVEVLRREGFRVEELPAVRRRLLRSPEESSLFAVYIITPP